MLRVNQSESTAAAKRYFGSSLRRGDYYLEGQEVAGMWGGKGAEMLGLSGNVARKEFMNLVENKRPDGSQLTARNRANRRPGYDFTFDVPKSVSIAHTLSGDDRIVQAMRTAAMATMVEIEEEMHARVRKDGAFEDRLTGNMIWADFVHHTSRPATLNRETEAELLASNPWLREHLGKDGRLSLPDPHLHMHVYAMNATYDYVEEMWKAGEFMRQKRDAVYYQAAYHARLAGELQKLGYAIEPVGKCFELAGIPRSTIDVFSRRTKEVEEAAKELGITNPDVKATLGAKTRKNKDSNLTMPQLTRLWRAMVGRQEAERLKVIGDTAKACQAPQAIQSPGVAKEAVTVAASHEFERASEVSEKRLLATALERAVGRVTVGQIHEARRMNSEIIEAKFEGEKRVTTLAILAEEAELVRFVKRGKNTSREIAHGNYEFQNPQFKIKSATNVEQRAAILHVLKSNDWIVGVVGRAGTGKTTLLHEVKAGVERWRRKLMVFAPTAEAARGVLRAEGFGGADTIKQLLVDKGLQNQIKGSVLWIDEAGMVGNRDMLAVLRLAKEKGAARVVLAGDSSQIRSVPRGDAFRYLENEAGLSIARLNTIQRQKTPKLKEAVEAISLGDVARGFELLGESKSIVQGEDNTAHRALAMEYAAIQTSKTPKSVLVVSPTHKEGAALTEVIRDELKASALLQKEERVFDRTVNLAMTDSEKANPAAYSISMVIQFKQNAPNFARSERALVVDVNTRKRVVTVLKNDGTQAHLPLGTPERFQVYRREDLAISVGDKLRITENGYDQSRQHRLNNGMLATVGGFTRESDIRLEDGRIVSKHFGNFAHGYVITADAAQAKTVDVVLAAISGDSMMATDMRRTYVTVSRARERVRIYTDDKVGLLAAAQRDSNRRSATEVVGKERAEALLKRLQMQEALRPRTISTPLPKHPTIRTPKAPDMEVGI